MILLLKASPALIALPLAELTPPLLFVQFVPTVLLQPASSSTRGADFVLGKLSYSTPV